MHVTLESEISEINKFARNSSLEMYLYPPVAPGYAYYCRHM